jgi:anaerobic selenocysteine-containing dehydrogenase
MIHPIDAQSAGIGDGDDVTVESASGRLGFVVKVSSDIAPGVAFAPINLSAAPLTVLYEDRRSLPRVRILK